MFFDLGPTCFTLKAFETVSTDKKPKEPCDPADESMGGPCDRGPVPGDQAPVDTGFHTPTPVHTPTTPTPTTTTTTTPTTTTTTPTTPGWTETTTTRDSWSPRTTTTAGKGWVHWTKMIQGHHYL